MTDASLDFKLDRDEPLLREYLTTVGEDSEYFRGHFPGHPVLPGVAQMEAIVFELATRAWPDLGALRELRRLKFCRIIPPNNELRIRLERKEATKVSFVMSLNASAEKCSSGVLCFGDKQDVG
ncbi:MAG: hypothetical protein GY811_16120 [Myxococcales bacterium]|nr:hypothetical protein [Myxococcales bacterium]